MCTKPTVSCSRRPFLGVFAALQDLAVKPPGALEPFPSPRLQRFEVGNGLCLAALLDEEVRQIVVGFEVDVRVLQVQGRAELRLRPRLAVCPTKK